MKGYHIACYYRLSREEEKDGESNSIRGQRDLVERELEKQDNLCVLSKREFVDDGYSGTNFDRPGFQALLACMQQGTVNYLLVKDLSRIGRNYLLVGQLLEQDFPLWGVRVRSVNDHYDSGEQFGRPTDLEVPLRNLIYDLYSKDLSKKIKSAKRIRMEQGENYFAYPIYGYRKDANGKSLVIDREAAKVVARTFQMSCEGRTPREIAQCLNGEAILTPGAYKKAQGEKKNWGRQEGDPFWTADGIRRILKDGRYTGCLIAGSWERGKIGSKKAIPVPMEQRIRRENAYPAIVSKETFEQSLEQMKKRDTTHRGAKKNSPSSFSGKVFCAYCHYHMERKGKEAPYYFCRTIRYSGQYGCVADKVGEELLEEACLFLFHYLLRKVCDQEILFSKWGKFCRDREKKEMEGRKKLQQRKKKLLREKELLYESYRVGNRKKEEYLASKECLEKNIGAIEKQDASWKETIQKKYDLEDFLENFEKFTENVLGRNQIQVFITEGVDKIEFFGTHHIRVFLTGKENI